MNFTKIMDGFVAEKRTKAIHNVKKAILLTIHQTKLRIQDTSLESMVQRMAEGSGLDSFMLLQGEAELIKANQLIANAEALYTQLFGYEPSAEADKEILKWLSDLVKAEEKARINTRF